MKTLHHQDSMVAVASAFNRVDLVSVRDNGSRDLLIKCGVDSSKIFVIPDLVFTLKPADGVRIDEIMREECFPQAKSEKNILIAPCCYNVDLVGWAEQYARFCDL
ncbi:MAG: polysaccharide pyruvyl transferase family protein [Cellvibrio sp.]|nr:polysaccharide pyruvyl transferase family protein [Cellvibrio sp.]